jgi:hypothetical protein
MAVKKSCICVFLTSEVIKIRYLEINFNALLPQWVGGQHFPKPHPPRRLRCPNSRSYGAHTSTELRDIFKVLLYAAGASIRNDSLIELWAPVPHSTRPLSDANMTIACAEINN